MSKFRSSVGNWGEIIVAVIKQVDHIFLNSISVAAGTVECNTDQTNAVSFYYRNTSVVGFG